jgi:oligopeptidase B
MKRTIYFLALSSLVFSLLIPSLSGAAVAQTNGNTPEPPIAKKIPKQMTIHGDTRADDYFWLREKTNAEVVSYLEAENAYADAVMKPTGAFQQALYKEMLGHIKQTDVNVPYRFGDYFYYSRTEEGKQYPNLRAQAQKPRHARRNHARYERACQRA